jgi:CheY-like chemotaxis protein
MGANGEGPLWGREVLVVEDDSDVRSVLCEALEAEGARPLAAAHGVEALKLLMEGARPAAMRVDLDLPLMDGRLLCEACDAAEELRAIPRVIVTGNPHAAFFMSRALLVLPKPVDVAEVLATLGTVCRVLKRAA